MSKISVWFLVAVVVFSAESNGLRFCPDNRVRRRELLNNIANEQPRLSIYSLEINSPFQYGKSVSIWRTETEISTETYSRNLDEDRCDEFPLNNGTITDRVEWRRSGLCRKFEWYITVDADDGRQDRFISQDTTKYFWWFSCFDGTTEVVDNCNQGYLDLVIPDTRTNASDINLNGTPWELIAEDLKDFTGLSTEDVRYVWLGEECSGTY